jgi:hypothetical protein
MDGPDEQGFSRETERGVVLAGKILLHCHVTRAVVSIGLTKG